MRFMFNIFNCIWTYLSHDGIDEPLFKAHLVKERGNLYFLPWFQVIYNQSGLKHHFPSLAFWTA